MTKDELKNRISMALKDPILQQGFEVICKELAISEHDREHNDYELSEAYKKMAELRDEVKLWRKASENNSYKAFQLEKENAELKKTVEHYRKEREFFIGEVEK